MKLWSELGGEPGIPADGSEKSEETHTVLTLVCVVLFFCSCSVTGHVTPGFTHTT